MCWKKRSLKKCLQPKIPVDEPCELLWQTECHWSTLGLSTPGLQDHISLTQTRPCLLAARSLQHSLKLSGRPSEGWERRLNWLRSRPSVQILGAGGLISLATCPDSLRGRFLPGWSTGQVSWWRLGRKRRGGPPLCPGHSPHRNLGTETCTLYLLLVYTGFSLSAQAFIKHPPLPANEKSPF